MKKALLVVLLLVAIMAGGVWYVFVNLDSLVRRGIETAGSEAVGTPVRVEAVEVDLAGGRAIIRGFTIANPEGFSDADMLSFSELVVVLDRTNLSREQIGIVSITATDPRVFFEQIGNQTNLGVIQARLEGEPPPEDTIATGVPKDIQLMIGNVMIENIGAALSSDALPQQVEVSLGDIRLQNLQGTPTQITQQILDPVIAQLSRNAANAMLEVAAERFGEQVRERVEEELRGVGAAIGDLFNRGGAEEEDPAPAQQEPQ